VNNDISVDASPKDTELSWAT